MAGRQSPLRDAHDDRGARFTDFGGWAMPVSFDSIREEHAAVRDAVGKFDVSHMGEVEVTGPDATALLQRLTTNDVTRLDPGEAQYSAVVDEAGVMHDDTVVYRKPDEGGDPVYLFVPNAGHDEWAVDRWTDHRDAWGLTATVRNETASYAMLAVQGPDAPGLVADAVTDGTDLDDLGRFEATTAAVAGVDCLVARTGYTGEDGFELLPPWGDARTVWDALDCQPCGLGARDTLRIEMGFLLSGQDFHPEDEPRTPYEAGIGFAVDLDTEFVGRDALAAATEPDEAFAGLRLLERGVPRNGYEVTAPDGDPVGHVTSGTMSPTLGEPVALGYLSSDHAAPGTELRVVVRGEAKRAETTETPFIQQ
ncbi:MAG: glycine cleavage system aminomethyltransferase GcvT [Haloferacaceae archaeon]